MLHSPSARGGEAPPVIGCVTILSAILQGSCTAYGDGGDSPIDDRPSIGACDCVRACVELLLILSAVATD